MTVRAKDLESRTNAALHEAWRSSGLNDDMIAPIRAHITKLGATDRPLYTAHSFFSTIDKHLWSLRRYTSLLPEQAHSIACQSILVTGLQGRLLYESLGMALYAHRTRETGQAVSPRDGPQQYALPHELSDLTEKPSPVHRALTTVALLGARHHDTPEENGKMMAKRLEEKFGAEEAARRFPDLLHRSSITFDRAIHETMYRAAALHGLSALELFAGLPGASTLVFTINKLTPFHRLITVDTPGGHSHVFQIDRLHDFRHNDVVDTLSAIISHTIKVGGDRIHNGGTLHPDTEWFNRHYMNQSLLAGFEITRLKRDSERDKVFDDFSRNYRAALMDAREQGMNEVSSSSRALELFKLAYAINSTINHILPKTLDRTLFDSSNERLHEAVYATSRNLSRSLWAASHALAAFGYRNALATFLYEPPTRPNPVKGLKPVRSLSPEEFMQLDGLAEDHVWHNPGINFGEERSAEGHEIYQGMWRVLAAAENKEPWMTNPNEYRKRMRAGKVPERPWLPEVGWRNDRYWHVAYSLVLSALGARWAEEFDAFERDRDAGNDVRGRTIFSIPDQEKIRYELSETQGE